MKRDVSKGSFLLLAVTGLAAGTQLPDGAGKAIVQKVCSGCHAPEIVMGRHETKEGWEQIVSSMVDKGANGTDDEFNTIIDYLATNFPKSNSGAKPTTKTSGGGENAK